MAKFLKPAKTYQEQLDLLKQRGMLIPDEAAALKALKEINYYRLSGYALEYKDQAGDKYVSADFNEILALHEFDRIIRHIMIKYLEEIEIKFRTSVAYCFSHEYGPYGHYMYWNFRDEGFSDEFESTCKTAICKNREALFVKHHLEKYSTPDYINIPLWVLVEILSFSTISKFYANLATSLQIRIADDLQTDSNYLINQAHCFANLRNICAHYGRIYGVDLRPAIKLNSRYLRQYSRQYNATLPTTKLFGYIVGMKSLLSSDSFNYMLLDIETAANEFHSILSLAMYGFPECYRDFLSNPVK